MRTRGSGTKAAFPAAIAGLCGLLLAGCASLFGVHVEVARLVPAVSTEAATIRQIAVLPFEGPDGDRVADEVLALLAGASVAHECNGANAGCGVVRHGLLRGAGFGRSWVRSSRSGTRDAWAGTGGRPEGAMRRVPAMVTRSAARVLPRCTPVGLPGGSLSGRGQAP